mmetsp:Transcript_74741/g.210746  ORF Transcript_74741/g.210746 Transcript_74741/m.210746 type:complete len:318 (+) Transcript_74741:141-1094(+)
MPQELSNTAWSFARLKFQDGPLLTAIAAEALLKITEFASLNIANTAWAFYVLSETSHVAAVLSVGVPHFLGIADHSVGTEWVDLVGVAESQTFSLFPGRDDLFRQFELQIFRPALEHLALLLDPMVDRMDSMRKWKIFVDERQLPHLGMHYTGRALTALSWHLALDSEPWVAAARMEAWAAQGLSIGTEVRTERIVAWVAATLCVRDLRVEIPGRLLHAGVPPEANEEVQGLLQPTFRHLSRDDHAERAALLIVVAALFRAGPIGTSQLAEVSGSLRLYVSHFPCISCLAVLGQFKRLLPELALAVAFDDAWLDSTM